MTSFITNGFILSSVLMIQLACASQKISIYSCDFDQTDCGFTFSSNGTQKITLSSIQYVKSNTYSISDVTSITKPAENGLYCVIPFKLGSEWFHCTNLKKCRTSNGKMSECRMGQFVSTRTNGDAFWSEIRLDQAVLSSPGSYELEYYVILYCLETESTGNCSRQDDMIIVSAYDLKSNQLLATEEHTLDTIESERVWLRKSVIFNSSEANIQLSIRINMRRTTQNNLKDSGFFGFDNLTIYRRLDDTSPDPTEPANTDHTVEQSTSHLTTSMKDTEITSQATISTRTASTSAESTESSTSKASTRTQRPTAAVATKQSTDSIEETTESHETASTETTNQAMNTTVCPNRNNNSHKSELLKVILLSTLLPVVVLFVAVSLVIYLYVSKKCCFSGAQVNPNTYRLTPPNIQIN